MEQKHKEDGLLAQHRALNFKKNAKVFKKNKVKVIILTFFFSRFTYKVETILQTNVQLDTYCSLHKYEPFFPFLGYCASQGLL